MLNQQPCDVGCAFDLLEGEIKTAIREIRQRAARHVEAGDDESAKELMEKARSMESLASKIGPLSQEWNGCSDSGQKPFTVHTSRRISLMTDSSQSHPEPLRECAFAGAKLPIEEYKNPIIIALGELGGRARAGVVLNKVFENVKDRLTPDDLRGKRSRPTEKNWYNRASWCRNDMKEDGLIRPDSPNRIWELTEKGWDLFHPLRLPRGEVA